MKLHHAPVAFAVFGLSVVNAAQLTPSAAAAAQAIYVSGSSALRFSLAAGFIEACDVTTITVFGNSNGAKAPGNNVRAYACTLSQDIKPSSGNNTVAFTRGTNVVLQKYDKGGSINGIQPLVQGTQLAYLNFGNCTATGLVRTGSFDLTKIDYACAQTNNAVPQIGVTDVEASLIQNRVNLPAGTSAVATTGLSGGIHSVGMAGVAVNKSLYRALQVAQGLPPDDAAKNAPSIMASFLTSIESGNGTPGNGTGFNLLIPDDGTSSGSNNQALNICSRQNGSGTKAIHNAFLLNIPCGGTFAFNPLGGNSMSATPVDWGDTVITLNASTDDVIACLNAAESAGSSTTSGGYAKNWAIGMVGVENDPAAGTANDANWRFVKVSGVYPSQVNGQMGTYPMTYENYLYYPSSLTGSTLSFAQWLRTDAVNPIALSKVLDIGTRRGILAVADITDPTYASVTSFIARSTRNGRACNPQFTFQ